MDRPSLVRLLATAAHIDVAGTSADRGVLHEPPARGTVVEAGEAGEFQRRFLDAVAAGVPVFVADPGWAAAERAQWRARVDGPAPTEGVGEGWLAMPTGGSSGDIKLARHDEGTLHAAVAGFASHFGVEHVHAVGLLPLHHVSGLMSWMRCALTGGTYRHFDWHDLLAGRLPDVPAEGTFLSLVPTQLQRLLDAPGAREIGDWLRRFRAVFVGGGPAWPELLDRAAEARLPISLSYGLTETAAMVAAQRPEEFLAGDRSCGTAMPHARLSLSGEGLLVVEAASLHRGLWPARREAGPLATDDLATLDEGGRLRVLGRRDALIITGGKKVNPIEVEAALRATGWFSDVAVVGVRHPAWGEMVVACFPDGSAAAAEPPSLAELSARLDPLLAPYKHPKRLLPVSPWPRSGSGKINRTALRALAQAAGAMK